MKIAVRLHHGLHQRRTSTLRWIVTARGGMIQAIRRNGDVLDAAAYRASMVRAGSGGIALFDSPGRLSVPFAGTKGTTLLNRTAWRCVHFDAEWVSRPLTPSVACGDNALKEQVSGCIAFHAAPVPLFFMPCRITQHSCGTYLYTPMPVQQFTYRRPWHEVRLFRR